jgi:hypothetical protein
MSLVEEEEEFVMGTKRLKSNKSASALRAVSRLNNDNVSTYYIRSTYYPCKSTAIMRFSLLEKVKIVILNSCN